MLKMVLSVILHSNPIKLPTESVHACKHYRKGFMSHMMLCTTCHSIQSIGCLVNYIFIFMSLCFLRCLYETIIQRTHGSVWWKEWTVKTKPLWRKFLTIRGQHVINKESSSQQLQTSPMVNIFHLLYYINKDNNSRTKKGDFRAWLALVPCNPLYHMKHQNNFQLRFFLHSVFYWRPTLTENTC